MRRLNVAFGFIQKGDKFLLQLRNGDPRIGGAGLIGCFGGKIDEGEDPLVTFCREIIEETSMRPQINDVRKLGIVEVESDHNLEPVKVTAHVFHWHAKGERDPKTNEGELVIMTRDEVFDNLDRFTSGTRAAIMEFL